MSLCGKNFILRFKDSRLGRSRIVEDADMPKVTKENGDPDGYIYVLCDMCNIFMNYEKDTEKWVCPGCGAKTKASSVYAKIGRDDDDFVNAHPYLKD